MDFGEKTLSSQHIYTGSIIRMDTLEVELPDGRISKRDIITHPGASVVVPITDKGEVYMVRQYRKPVETVLLEVPAGKLNPGEKPEDCARRELKEETGLEAEKLRYAISIHSTPGFSNEILHIFTAEGLTDGESSTDEDEFITTEKIPVEKLVDMVMKHEITDAKSIIGIFLAERLLREKKEKR